MRAVGPIKAIRHCCVECMGGSKKYVRECDSKECLLHQYRFGKKPKSKGNNLSTVRSIKFYCQKCGEKKRIDATRCNVAECSLFPFRKGHNPNRKGIGNSDIALIKKASIEKKKSEWGNTLLKYKNFNLALWGNYLLKQLANVYPTNSTGDKKRKLFIRAREVAEMLCVGISTIYAYVDKGALKPVYLPHARLSFADQRNRRFLRFSYEDICEFIKQVDFKGKE